MANHFFQSTLNFRNLAEQIMQHENENAAKESETISMIEANSIIEDS